MRFIHSAANYLYLKGYLRVAFQGLLEQEFLLERLYEEAFSWFPSSLEMMRRGRYPLPVSYYLLTFERDALGAVSGLGWLYCKDQSITLKDPGITARPNQVDLLGFRVSGFSTNHRGCRGILPQILDRDLCQGGLRGLPRSRWNVSF